MARAKRRARRGLPKDLRRAGEAPEQSPLFVATDHGRAVRIPPQGFAPPQRGGGWGAFAESFLRANARGLAELEVRPELAAGGEGVSIRLAPGGRAGAVPLRSAQSEQVVGGFVVKPRFGWAGVGRVLHATGWAAAPELMEMPLVPGSGREVPAWVIAGPVLRRMRDLLASMRPGYEQREEVLRRPRGRIVWRRYTAESLARGRWHELPCRYPDLAEDPRLRRMIRWTLERVHRELARAGYDDPMARHLAGEAARLLDRTADVVAESPTRSRIDDLQPRGTLRDEVMSRGLEAISWVFDERGLGGGRELDGLAWRLPLDRAWEAYVEAVVREEARRTGGRVSAGRLGQTVFPLLWSDPLHRSLGHLEPDLVVRRGRSVHVVDAKYKAHLAEIDEHGWRRFADEVRERHRADVHQVLAYAALFEADEIRATLVYPLRRGTYEILAGQGRDRSTADLTYGGRRVELELRGLPFGMAA